MLQLGLISVAVGVSVWFAGSTFVPFAADQPIRYVLCTESPWRMLADVAVAAGLLAVACRVVERFSVANNAASSTFYSASLFTPLSLVAANLASIGLLVPGLREWWSPIAYIADAMYPVLWLVAAAWVTRNIYASARPLWSPSLTARWTALDPVRQSLLIDVSVAVVVGAIVIASSPQIRFSGVPIGDEPKYLRYAENWWQGRGMDMDGIRDASDIPASKEAPHFLRNFTNIVPALRRDLSQLAGDLSYLGNAKHWGHRFNRATYVGNWFVTGKNGGLYQIHQPGISIVILPAYALDRWLFDRGRKRFADDLFAVNTVMLLIFLVLAAVSFRLINGIVKDRGIAAITTVAAFASLPLAAFAFQFYPETMGALLVAAVAQRATSPAPLTRSRAVAIAVALGWLVWLQVRFALLAAVLFLWTVSAFRKQWLVIAAVSGALVGLFCFYVYHVTGSVLPSALYTATPDPGFRTARLPIGLPGVLFDRENGLFALAPMFLLALPGLGVMLRQQRREALTVLTLLLAVMIPVAGHGYETSGSNPLRHMVAVVPVAAVPVAAWLKTIRGRIGWSAAAGLLLLVSVQMAIAYNLRNDKTIMQAVVPGIAGWDPSFLFPLLRRTDQHRFDAHCLLAWELLGAAAVAWGYWRGPRFAADVQKMSAPGVTTIAASLALLPVAAWIAFAAGGPRRDLRLLKTAEQSLRECRSGCGDRASTVCVSPATRAIPESVPQQFPALVREWRRAIWPAGNFERASSRSIRSRPVRR